MAVGVGNHFGLCASPGVEVAENNAAFNVRMSHANNLTGGFPPNIRWIEVVPRIRCDRTRLFLTVRCDDVSVELVIPYVVGSFNQVEVHPHILPRPPTVKPRLTVRSCKSSLQAQLVMNRAPVSFNFPGWIIGRRYCTLYPSASPACPIAWLDLSGAPSAATRWFRKSNNNRSHRGCTL